MGLKIINPAVIGQVPDFILDKFQNCFDFMGSVIRTLKKGFHAAVGGLTAADGETLARGLGAAAFARRTSAASAEIFKRLFFIITLPVFACSHAS